MLEIQELDRKGLRNFGFITGIIFILSFAILLPWVFEYHNPLWPWILAIILWVPSIVYPPILAPVYKLWMKFGLIMGWVMNRVILSTVFFSLFTPISLFFKLIGKDLISVKIDRNITSYRKQSEIRQPSHMEHPY